VKANPSYVMRGNYGQDSSLWTLEDQVLIPNRAHQVGFLLQPRIDWDVIQIDHKLMVDNEMLTLFTHRYSEDELIDAYERVHHRVHGYDVRGLDPREGPTRLTGQFSRR
jgi:hypothetical protein